ncbi:DUF5134 domain-containing protein [Prauserella cavernicola]|uniref:DUF5134 domain-containing protein n=1 Tax=Prauserella cavernicola TaxID=2800127 RepID=A0A934V9C0_9PSEU|nr:DUF5134 domain-containing protein [Prauserella cavernicola]MBK1788683.1 DUF5134 domain-containing protein [Prauserella cavernicola]
MGIPGSVAWLLTGAFLLLTLPCVLRLVRLDYVRLGGGVRQIDLAALLMTLAMVAMVSPVGAPVPVPGWQALFLLTAGWFLVGAVRGRRAEGVCRGCDLHHALSAVAMLYMLTAMPHGGHGTWPTMVAGDDPASLAWPVVAVLAAVYFAVDGVRAGVRALHTVRGGAAASLPEGFGSRTLCRVVMGLGMGYLFAAAL